MSDYFAIAFIKKAINKQLFLRRRTRSLELGGCQWWQVGTVERRQRCRLECYPDIIRDIIQLQSCRHFFANGCARCRGRDMIQHITEYRFCKPFDRGTAEVQVVLRAIKFQGNDSVSFYGTIRYIMRLLSQTHYFKPNTLKRHTSWLLFSG